MPEPQRAPLAMLGLAMRRAVMAVSDDTMISDGLQVGKPSRLIARIASHFPGGKPLICATCWTPALLARMSRGPKAARHALQGRRSRQTAPCGPRRAAPARQGSRPGAGRWRRSPRSGRTRTARPPRHARPVPRRCRARCPAGHDCQAPVQWSRRTRQLSAWSTWCGYDMDRRPGEESSDLAEDLTELHVVFLDRHIPDVRRRQYVGQTE
jgi:hypothetical protein